MNNIIKLPIITKADHRPDDILEAAKGKLSRVIVLGETEDGERWVSGSFSDLDQIIVDLELAKAWVAREVLRMEDGASIA